MTSKMFPSKTLWFSHKHNLIRCFSAYSSLSRFPVLCHLSLIYSKMFISWKVISWTIAFLVVILWFFTTLESPMIIWFFLEGGVWSLFFFFFKGQEENKLKNSIRFFIVQGFCSLVWVILNIRERNFLREVLLPLIIFLKIGLIPGHYWVWKIYEGGNLYLIWFISSLQKIIPLGIVYSSLEMGVLSSFSMKIFLILNIAIIIYFFLLEINFFLFLLSSRILHFNNIVLLLVNEKLVEVSFYFFSYLITLFFGLIGLVNFEKSFSSPDSGEPFWGKRNWILLSLSLVGFPPRLIFVIKLIFLLNSRELLSSFFILAYVALFLVYMIVLVSSFIRYSHFSCNRESNLQWNFWEKEQSFKSFLFLILVSFSFFFFDRI